MAVTDEVRPLLERFAADVGRVLPLVALWAHGSLALGDFRPGVSDLDLIALIAAPVTAAEKSDLQLMHAALAGEEPLADKLHCSYVVESELGGTDRDHLTWAHGELFERPVSPVTRRELCQGGLCLTDGPAPAAVVPLVTDEELKAYIRADLRDFWYPHTAQADLWLRDIWVDLGLVTFARATVTLSAGRLVTKREALEILPGLGAPADVVRDIYQRRYAAPVSMPEEAPMSDDWRTRRGDLARGYLGAAIGRLLDETPGWA